MMDLPDKKFKLIIRKKGKKRGVTKYFKAGTFEETQELAIRYICDRHDATYEDHFKFGDGPKATKIIDDQDHLVIEYKLELGWQAPIDYYIDMRIDYSDNKIEGGFL